MTALDPHFRELLTLFNSNGVRYLILGGYAVNIHGYHRNTKDLDVWVAIDPENAERVSMALQQYGFSKENVSPERFATPGFVWAFGRPPVRVDILTSPSGVEFEAAYQRRIDLDVEGLTISVIGLADLLQNKRASGRPKDELDVAELRDLNKDA